MVDPLREASKHLLQLIRNDGKLGTPRWLWFNNLDFSHGYNASNSSFSYASVIDIANRLLLKEGNRSGSYIAYRLRSHTIGFLAE
jgi:hypothetical protein